MNEKQLKKLLDSPKIVDEKIEFYIKKKILITQEFEEAEMKGDVEKAEHNSNFIQDNVNNPQSEIGGISA